MITRRQFMTRIAALAAGVSIRPAKARPEGPPIRVAVSMDTLAGVNVNDARAAYRVWGDEIARTLAMRHSEMLSQVFIPSAELLQMIREGRVDCFALTALEYARILDYLDPAWMVVEDYAVPGLEYLLLVRDDSPFHSLKDLRNAKLLVHHHRDTCLLEPWITIRLAAEGLGPFDGFFGAPETRDKVSEVILPLFFGSIQAAALTQRSFATAVELNPQLGRQLRVLATSPSLIPAGFWFRKGCDPADKLAFQESVLRLNSVPAGRQVLALYQSTGFCERPCSIMRPTLELIGQYNKLRSRGARR